MTIRKHEDDIMSQKVEEVVFGRGKSICRSHLHFTSALLPAEGAPEDHNVTLWTMRHRSKGGAVAVLSGRTTSYVEMAYSEESCDRAIGSPISRYWL